MRLIRRDDASLALALIAGAVLLFHRPLQFAFDLAGDIQQRYGIDLVQALVVLSVAFGFHQYGKRHQAKAQALAAAAEARQARLRSEELERAVALGRALGGVTDFTGLSQILLRHLPKFVGERPWWVLICAQGYWDVLLRDTDDRRTTEQLEAVATRALDEIRTTRADHVRVEDLVAFPLWGGAEALGMMFVRATTALTAEEIRSLDAVTASIGIAVRNLQTLIETRDRSVRDALTGCFNRAHALEAGAAELRRARRHDRPLSLIMFDVDRFKSVNDTYGHLVGDQILAEIGRRLSDVVRVTDVKCRYGGDEFLVILPETSAAGAEYLAESLRSVLSKITVPTGTEGAAVSITVSVGVATVRGEDRDVVSVITRADQQLYDAKRRGRNCISADSADPPAALRLVSSQGGVGQSPRDRGR